MRLDSINLLLIFFIAITVGLVHSRSKSDDRQLFVDKYPIPNETPDPINIDTKKAHFMDLPPLNLVGTLFTVATLSNIGKSVQATVLQPFTFAQASGGVLGSGVYEFSQILYYWTDDLNGTATISVNGKGPPIVFMTYFKNRKYSTVEIALKQRDGFAGIAFPLSICSTPQKAYNYFSSALKRVRKVGSSTLIFLGASIAAGDHEYINTTYFAYPGSYVHPITGKRYFCVTVIYLIPSSAEACISIDQFKDTFGSFKQAGKKSTNKLKQFPAKMPIVQARGVVQEIFPLF